VHVCASSLVGGGGWVDDWVDGWVCIACINVCAQGIYMHVLDWCPCDVQIGAFTT